MILDMLAYYNMIKELNISIIYSGPIWADGIEGIGGTLKKRLAYDELPLSASKSVFSVFVEQMNNMLMYSADREQITPSEEDTNDTPAGVFILGSRNKSYFIQSGNIIKNESVRLLEQRINHLNTLDEAGKRKYYKEQIKSENLNPESKGAGLGLIEIARRASSKIDYKFTPLNDDVSFFSMFVTIG